MKIATVKITENLLAMIEIATLRRSKAQTEFRVLRSTQDERLKIPA